MDRTRDCGSRDIGSIPVGSKKWTKWMFAPEASEPLHSCQESKDFSLQKNEAEKYPRPWGEILPGAPRLTIFINMIVV